MPLDKQAGSIVYIAEFMSPEKRIIHAQLEIASYPGLTYSGIGSTALDLFGKKEETPAPTTPDQGLQLDDIPSTRMAPLPPLPSRLHPEPIPTSNPDEDERGLQNERGSKR